MVRISFSSVVQGYFSGTVPKPLLQSQQAAIQPHAGNRTSRRPPTYLELTVQAHQRSSASSVQPMHNETAFLLPPHLATFGHRSGRKLPTDVQQRMESFFGADFSDVQVHTGAEASSIGALAFTQGSDIYFGLGQYNPNSHFGQKLLAHELTHVLQQRGGRVRNPFGSGVAVVQDPVLESEAERMGMQAAMHIPPAQAKIAKANPVQQAVSPHLSGSIKVRDGTHKITVAQDGKQTGSVMVHSDDRTTIEVTDLGVDAPHRGKGLGQKLLASALHAGLRLGKKRVRLGVADNGNGRLTGWYKQMGFRQTGVDQQGRPRMEASINRVLSSVAQGRFATGTPSGFEGGQLAVCSPAALFNPRTLREGRILQRMEGPPTSAPSAEDNLRTLQTYRPSYLTDEIEPAFLKAGYTTDNVRAAILRGLRAWGGHIPGHGSSKAGKDSGEQGDTGKKCDAAKAFLLNWVSQNPAGGSSSSSHLRHDEMKEKEGATRKEKKKEKRAEEKHAHWHTKQGHTEVDPPRGKRCPVCAKSFEGMK